MSPPRAFNTAGPCNPERHYTLPAAERLPEARSLIEAEGYFVVHAPRQTGKTTTLRAIAAELRQEGRWAALHFSCETAEPAQDDYGAAEQIVLSQIRQAAHGALATELQPPPWPDAVAGERLGAGLRAWAARCPQRIVLFFDEIDALRGESLRSVLRQLRAGFPDRPARFPASVVLCGLRDVRDYKVASGGDPTRLGSASPFNVKVESMRLGDFAREEVAALYRQHTDATGQAFTPEALACAFDMTKGQPWLVNALAREVIEKIHVPVTETIVLDHVGDAKERLILARATHLDSLVARLLEPRVRRVVGPLLEGSIASGDTYDDDVAYARDLGLVATSPLRIANPIYREVIVRVLSSSAADSVTADPRSFVLPDGRFALRRMLEAFAEFWREHGELLEVSVPYREVAPQLVLMAFLQRVVNGGGHVDREYGIGRGRIDLLVRWPFVDAAGKKQLERHALELKVWAPKKKDPLERGLGQLAGYLDGLGLTEGTLVIFNRRPDAGPFEERCRFEEAHTAGGHRVTVLRA